MKLQLFNGGKSERVAPHLIGITEGVTYSNIDNSKGNLSPVNKHSSTKTLDKKYSFYFEAKDEWIESDVNRDYVEFQEKIYYSEDNTVPKVYDGTNTYNLGIVPPPPGLTAVLNGAGNLTGTYQYVYTYYNQNTGEESGPSAPTAEIAASANTIRLQLFVNPPESQVTHLRIYRVGGNLTTFTLVDTITVLSLIYDDNIADTDVDGRLLETTGWNAAKSGAQFLTEAYAMMFYALGDKVYFTPIGKPWAWPELYFIDFPLTVTGIAVVHNGLLVFTKLKTYIITGNTPTTLSRYTLSESQGCKSHKTIAYMDTTPVWVSNDGLCASNGGAVQVISRDKLGVLKLTPIVAVALDDVYYLQHAEGSLVYDTRFGPIFKDLNLGNTYLVVGNDKIYGYFTDGYYELFQDSTFESFTYLSPQFLEGSYTERKKYKTFYLRSEGQIDITIYLDGQARHTWNLTTTDTHDLDTPQEYREAYSVQFLITGTGTVHELLYNAYGNERD